MNHPANPERGGGRPSPAGVALVLLLVVSSACVMDPAGGSGAGTIDVDVLVFFDDSDYRWAPVEVGWGASALCATEAACRKLGLDLNYSTSQHGAFVTGIGMLHAPADFSWWWYLLEWNRSTGSWEEAPSGASDLRLDALDAICWCPNATAPPSPDRATADPWPSFRGGAQNTGRGMDGGRSGISRLPPTSTIPRPFDEDVYTDRSIKTWEYDLGNGPIDSTPAVAGGRIFVSTGGVYNWTTSRYDRPPHLFALDAWFGHVLWYHETTAAGWQVSSPAVGGGRVIMGTSDGKVLAIFASDGRTAWTFSTGPSATGVTASPTIANGTVFIAAGDGRLTALSLEGRKLWDFPLGAPAYMCTPAFSAGRLVAGADNGVLSCVNAATGALEWNLTAGGKIRASPAVSEGTVYFVSTTYEGFTAVGSRLHAVSLATGQEAWNVTVPASTSSPAVSDGRIYIGGAGGLAALSTSGSVLWTHPTPAPVQSSPACANGRIYYTVNGPNGTLDCVLDLGERAVEDWSFAPRPANYLLCSPALACGRLYFGSDNGRLYCFGWYDTPLVSVEVRAPADMEEGTPARVSFDVSNEWHAPLENLSFGFWVDGDWTDEFLMIDRLDPGETATLTLDWDPVAGRHELSLGGLEGIRTVHQEDRFVNVHRGPRPAVPTEVLLASLAMVLASGLAALFVGRARKGRGAS